MPDTGDDPLQPYRQRVGAVTDTLGIDAEIELVLARDWGGDPRGDRFTLYAPPHREGQEHVLLHYLATFHMIEEGWQSPVFRYDTDFQYRLANRTADAFTDYWAYRLVTDRFGPEHIREYPAWLLAMFPQDVVDQLRTDGDTFDFDDDQFTAYCYVFAVDWYAMVPALTRPLDAERADSLVTQGEEVVEELEMADVLPVLSTIRDMFNSFNDVAAFADILPDQEEVFRRYYATVWSDEPPASIEDFDDPRHA